MKSHKEQGTTVDTVVSSDNSEAPQQSAENQLYNGQDQKVHSDKSLMKSKFGMNRFSKYKGIIGLVQIVVGVLLLVFIISTFIFQSYQVVGESMHPTLSNGDRLVVSKIGKTWSSIFRQKHLPKRGQIIVFDSPIDHNRQLIKRVIGLPGDKVVVDHGVITIYNDQHPEGFMPDANITDTPVKDVNYTLTKVVEADHIFVSGDNRVGGASLDSRNDLGLVPIENIIGELVIRLLPLSDSRLF